MNKEEIVQYVKTLKKNQGSDPIRIAEEYMGYKVTYIEDEEQFLTGKAVRYRNQKLIIINKLYNEKGKKVICAHELAHIILHKGENKFNGEDLQKEYEANLFAVTLLFNEEDFNMRFVDMSNYVLKSILDYNLK